MQNTCIEQYPVIKKYLLQHKEILLKRAEAKDGLYSWYRLQRPRNKSLFNASIKIVTPYRSEYNKFAYDDQQYYNDGGDIRIIVLKNPSENIYKYCLGLLNSKLLNYYFHFIGRKKGNMYEYFKDSLENIPIKFTSEERQKPLIKLVNKILDITKLTGYIQDTEKQAKVKDIEGEIDELVYELYGLTDEEIEVVET